MSPSDRAWLHAPGSEQTLRLPVSNDSQTTTFAFLQRLLFTRCPRGFTVAPLQSGCKGTAFLSNSARSHCFWQKLYEYLTARPVSAFPFAIHWASVSSLCLFLGFVLWYKRQHVSAFRLPFPTNTGYNQEKKRSLSSAVQPLLSRLPCM